MFIKQVKLARFTRSLQYLILTDCQFISYQALFIPLILIKFNINFINQ